MDYRELAKHYASLTTAHLADACIRAKIPVRCAPASLQAVVPGSRLAGRVLPSRHAGSVDIFLEALEASEPGEVLVVDNAARTDESCVGDLVVQEAKGAGLSGIVIWGLHRDTADIKAIGLPVFSLGSLPTGPQRLDPRPPKALELAYVGDWQVSSQDMVIGDEDGVLFIPLNQAEKIFVLAAKIFETERKQAELARNGQTLRAQLHFDDYLASRKTNPGLTFRDYLRGIGGAIEE